MSLDDCWILEIPPSDIPVTKLPPAVWKEFKLPYDFGEPRCAHSAGMADILIGASSQLVEQRLMIVGGLTQPFYETAMKLKVNSWCLKTEKKSSSLIENVFLCFV